MNRRRMMAAASFVALTSGVFWFGARSAVVAAEGGSGLGARPPIAPSLVADRITFGLSDGESVVIALDRENAPYTCAAFVHSCRLGIYTGSAWTQAGPELIYGGSDNPDGSLRIPKAAAFPRMREANNGVTHDRGSVSLTALRGASGLHDYFTFCIGLNALPSMDGEYTVFGHVVEGLDHLEAINLATAEDGASSVTIQLVTIE